MFNRLIKQENKMIDISYRLYMKRLKILNEYMKNTEKVSFFINLCYIEKYRYTHTGCSLSDHLH